jgi:hypothetical protein
VWQVERADADAVTTEVAHHSKSFMYTATLRYFWPRLLCSCMGWVANDFAFYGNKLFQSTFIALLYPEVSNMIKGSALHRSYEVSNMIRGSVLYTYIDPMR